MARTVKDAKLDTRAQREKLKTGDAIYWRMLVPGKLHIGYRRRIPGNPGVWIARRYIGKSPECTSGYLKTTLGRADDYQDAEGRSVLSYAHAQKLAYERSDAKDTPEATKVPTVKEAMADYINGFLKVERKTGNAAEQAAALHILPVLGSFRIDKLTLKQLEAWKSDLASVPARVRSRPGDPPRFRPEPQTEKQKNSRMETANRNITNLKAALNYARRHHPGVSDAAWRELRKFGKANGKVNAARPGHLSVAEAQRLINASEAGSGFRDLVQAGLLTGARYGELCRLRVADFGRKRIHIAESKNGKSRDILLTDEGVEFFQGLCSGRPGDQLVFRRRGGLPWGKSNQAQPMVAACKAAGIDPAIGFHQLRHTWASLSIMSGMPMILIAEALGHSGGTKIVEQHYGHLTDDYRDQMIRDHAPRFGISPASNVVPLKEAI